LDVLQKSLRALYFWKIIKSLSYAFCPKNSPKIKQGGRILKISKPLSQFQKVPFSPTLTKLKRFESGSFL